VEGLSVRGFKKYAQTILAGLLGLAVLAGLNVLAAKNTWRYDSTANKRHSLTEKSLSIVSGLESEVEALAFFRPGEPGRAQAESLLELYASRSENFAYEMVDPDVRPYLARELDVVRSGTIVLASGDKKEKVAEADEEKLTNAVIRVTDPARLKVYAATGHGEADVAGAGEFTATRLAEALKAQGVAVEPARLVEFENMPRDAAAVLLLGPKKDLLENEFVLLSNYLARGGRIFLALSPESDTPKLSEWLREELGVERREGLVLDPVGRLVGGDYLTPVAQDYPFAPASGDFDLMTLFPTAGALAPVEDDAAPVFPMVRSTEQAWLETDIDALTGKGEAEFDEASDVPGPLWLAAAYEMEFQPEEGGGEETAKAARALVFADQDFLTDQFAGVAGNLDLALNGINWLTERGRLITIGRPAPANALLFLESGERLLTSLVPLLILPGLLLVTAGIVAFKRRRGGRIAKQTSGGGQ
jgi:ABC-type uncharacterized transport system involved in gliding motility auxiliary subunit